MLDGMWCVYCFCVDVDGNVCNQLFKFVLVGDGVFIFGKDGDGWDGMIFMLLVQGVFNL